MSKVKKEKEEAYFFRMGKYADRLIAHIESHPDFIRRQPTKDSGPLCPVRNLVLGLRHYRIVINHPGIAALGYHHRPETVESRSVGNGSHNIYK